MTSSTSSNTASRSRTHGTIARALLLAVLVAGALAASATSASAVLVHLSGGKAVSYQPLRGARGVLTSRPFDAFFSNLDYNGGPVMPSNTNYTFYWAPSGSPAYPTGYQQGINRYFEDLAHDSGGHENVDSVATQYNDAAGEFANYDSHFGGAIIDKDPYPANGCSRAPRCLTDAQIQEEIERYVTEHKLPEGLAHEYFLLTPPEVENCLEASGSECSAGSTKPTYCAYHGNIPVGETQIIYSNDSYVTGNAGCDDGEHPNNKPSDGALEGGISHEHNESITDPEPNNAWTDFGSEVGGEDGDKCRNTKTEAEEFGAPLGTAADGSRYNQEINGSKYWYQQEWSNQGNACRQRLSFSGERPTAKITAVSEGGNAVRLDATGSTAAGGVSRYNWQFNEAPSASPSKPVETAAASISHTFSKSGPHLVALTVLAADGTSIGAAKTIVLGDTPPTAAFSASPGSTSEGTPVSFDGSGSSSTNGGITSYAWNFGDGSSAAGATASHAYAAAGAYEATLAVTDGSGFTTSVTHDVTVTVAGESGESGESGGGGSGAVPVPSPVPVLPVASVAPVALAPVAPISPVAPQGPMIHGSARVLKVKLNRDGSADLTVRVSAAGLLSAAELHSAGSKYRRARVRAARVRARAAGVVKLHVALASAGLRAIAAKSHLTLSVSLSFTPVPPTLPAAPTRVTLRLSRHRRL